MKRVMKAIAAIMLMTVAVCSVGCNKDDDSDDGGDNIHSDVRVTTYTPQDITQTSAVCGGDAIVTQGLSLTEFGVCWGTEHNPTAEGSHLSTTNWNEPYVCTITGLEPGTNYHVRAYALRGLEYYYGEDKSFTTEGNGGGGGWDSHTWVDLGLPSGTLWATCNVGATTPEEYGDYFAWGETQPKDCYNLSTYKYYNGNSLTKYTGSDGLTVLQLMDDAATANWGSNWCMPTREQWQELIDNTTNTWTTQNSVYGRLFTSTKGNSIFLPAARSLGFAPESSVSYGWYWSSSLYLDGPYEAWFLQIEPNYCRLVGHARRIATRCYGFSVRAVRKN